ncbi:MAG: DUF465 domain-containing protein [Pseudomonadota bacterium]
METARGDTVSGDGSDERPGEAEPDRQRRAGFVVIDGAADADGVAPAADAPDANGAAPGPAANDEALLMRLHALQQDHADLAAAVDALTDNPHHDRLTVARLKKKKLSLKDQIEAVKDKLTPDIIA